MKKQAVCPLFFIVCLVVPLQLSAQAINDDAPLNHIKSFMKNIKKENFDQVKEQLVEAERKNFKIKKGSKIMVNGRGINFAKVINGNVKYEVDGVSEGDEGKYLTVNVRLKEQDVTQTIPFQIKKQNEKWVVSLRKTMGVALEIAKSDITQNKTWRIYDKYRKGLNYIRDVGISSQKSLFSAICETIDGFLLIIRDIKTKENVFKRKFKDAKFTGGGFSLSGKYYVISMKKVSSGDESGLMLVFNTEDWEVGYRLKRRSVIRNTQFTPNEKVITFSSEGKGALWDLSEQKITTTLDVPEKVKTNKIREFIFGSSTKPHLVGIYDRKNEGNGSHLIAWNYKSGQALEVSKPIEHRVNNGVFINNNFIAVAGDKTPVLKYKLPSLERTKTLLEKQYSVTSLVFSEPSNLIYSNYITKPRVYNMANGKTTYLKNGARRTRDMEISKDGSYVISGERTGKVKVWKKELEKSD